MPAFTSLLPVRDRRDKLSREALLQRVRGEFHEMPCLRLTRGQAQRLFGLRADICQRVLATLMRDGALTCDSDGRYRLNDAGLWPARPALSALPQVLPSKAS